MALFARFFRITAVFAALFVFAGVPFCAQADSGSAEKRSDTKVWRIAYAEGGAFSDYQRILRGVAIGLQRAGLIKNGNVPLPAGSEETAPMWAWLAENAGGRIEFVKNAHYSADWDSAKRETVKNRLTARVRRGEIDLVLAFGTWAGHDFALADIDVPVVVASVTNAVESGIILSVEDSGRDNVAASIEPERYKNQVILFHNIFNFKKLGIAYEDTPAGRSSVSLTEIENAAQELGIELVRCTDTFDISDTALAGKRLKLCHEKFAEQGADAVYLTLNIGLQPETTADILEPLIQAYIPTFSQAGQQDVKHGALLSISQLNMEEEGIFTARQIVDIVGGAKPRSLNQVYGGIISLAMNLRMATLIGWNPPLELLIAVDEFYQEIE